MNIVEGAISSAAEKSFPINFSGSPWNFEETKEHEIVKKERLHSAAIALTRNVFPVPGGP
jgi:hypothetical protein